MRIVRSLVLLFAAIACASARSTGAAKRRLTQDTTPLQFNVTLGGISEISSDQASRIQSALSSSLVQPEAADVAVSSNTIVQDDQLTLIILVYPSSDADAATLQSELEALATGNQFTDNLRAMDIPVTTVTVNSVKPQPASQSVQRAPVTGSSLAGVLAVIAVGVILVGVAGAFGVRSLFQIRDQMAKAKAGYSTVELSDPHQTMEAGMLPEDSSPRHSPMAGRSGSPTRGRADEKQH
ncbi:hypothetical protein WJX79_007176 [Trebouxia sp. C0005]|nr:MAG: hypothetical protein FRX49_05692 [Trebouxia sp. A1-2]